MPKVTVGKFTEGNAKLLKTSRGKYRALGWGLPADHAFLMPDGRKANTCPKAGACKAVCYAKQGRYVMHNVRDARLHNLEVSLRPDFKETIVSDLSQYLLKSKVCRKPYNVVRLHDSGDFYNQSYVDSWAYAAAQFPEVIFYAYTKSLHLDFSGMPPNFRIVRSVGGKLDRLIPLNLPNSRIFSSHKARKEAGYMDGNRSDIPAIEGRISIGLVYHGTKDLTKSQIKFFG